MEIAEQVNQALKFVKERNYISAEKIYLELLEKQSENHIILSFLGYLYLETKKYKKAEQQFEKAYSINQTETILSGLASTWVFFPLATWLMNKSSSPRWRFRCLVKPFCS